ncbi:MAG: UvrB/UvrC motif-containing protein [candidate division Zixibacteria bacterium]|nr:UvrB/UvrC motif-containing protein [candidate division Zixibacteria bacterium]
MLCQDCKKREAQVHLTQIINNEKTTLHLCNECAAARGFHSPLDNVPFPLAEILSGLSAATPGLKQKKAEQITCPNCGLTFQEFTNQGRFGCGECYKAFRPQLEPIMRKIHGASLHRGRTPTVINKPDTDGEKVLPVREEERLEDELAKAIEREDFERAAEIRDKLKSIRESLTSDE